MSWFLASFKGISDPRRGNATRYRLLDLLTIALTASICGAESCVDFADFARDRRALFRDFLDLPDRLPSHDTFSRLFRLLDPAAFGRCFADFLHALGSRGAGQVAIDGKTLRATFEASANTSPLHLVTAFATDQRLALAQIRAQDGDEIAAARRVLDLFDLTGVLVSADAVHCQIETAKAIGSRGGDWLFGLKTNRRRLYDDVIDYFADPACPAEVWQTVDAAHGRIETRRARVSHDTAWLTGGPNRHRERVLPGIATIGVIETTVERAGQTCQARRAYVSSRVLSAQAFAAAVRAHWLIENTLHWVLDTGLAEDRCTSRKDNAPDNLAILRRLALNVLQTARPTISIRRKRKRSGWSDDFARSILSQMR